MNAYMFHGGDSSLGAMIVFAADRQKAKVLGFNNDPGICDGEYIYARVNKMKMTEHLESLMEKDWPHVIESPPPCPGCVEREVEEAHWYATKYCEGDHCKYDSEGATRD